MENSYSHKELPYNEKQKGHSSSLLYIERQFWQNVPLRLFDWGEAVSAEGILADPLMQDSLLQLLGIHTSTDPMLNHSSRTMGVSDSSAIASLADHHTTLPAPCASKAYRGRFLKALVKALESGNLEPSDTLYMTLGSIVGAVDQPETTCHRCYYLPPVTCDGVLETSLPSEMKRIILTEEIADISHGTTGLRTWQAGLRLIEYFAEDPNQRVAGRHFLELGSGVGLLGMACSLLAATSVYMTDIDDLVISRLEQNVGLNQLQESVAVFKLDWECSSSQLQETISPIRQRFDTIIGADIVYSPDLIQPLVRTIQTLLYAASNPQLAECWISSTQRQKSTQSAFLNQLADSGLTIQTVPLNPASWFHYDEGSDSVQVIIIRLK
ncbi:hypothetical protein BASA50_005824 [Batrachochytrium salamandrivorans]|uniref:FAM86 N-terminal domain-containing protein n=1 Tax=Batrachochytrium salamandrivorans TaxID=1357716 RepID=A0ABQ8FBK9_9FUNG|nr:hypothetical protein BASA50_005824 [Batrachochytrium salamandrivorans]